MKKLVISRKDLKNNLKIIRKMLCSPGKNDSGNYPRIIAVVKGNGMGLGLVEYSKFLVNQGIDCLAVSNLEEVIALRDSGINEEILMLTPTSLEKEMAILIEKKATITISSVSQMEMAEKLANRFNCSVNAHIKIDTGFGRYGFLYTNQKDILDVFKMSDKVKLCGTYTHFARPLDEKFTKKQFERFIDVIEYLKKEGQDPGILHVSESTAFIKYRLMNLNAVRLRFNYSRKNFNKSSEFN